MAWHTHTSLFLVHITVQCECQGLAPCFPYRAFKVSRGGEATRRRHTYFSTNLAQMCRPSLLLYPHELVTVSFLEKDWRGEDQLRSFISAGRKESVHIFGCLCCGHSTEHGMRIRLRFSHALPGTTVQSVG